MKTRSNIIAALSALALTLAVGCVGELGGDAGDGDGDGDGDTNEPDTDNPIPDDEDDLDTPRALFEKNVSPLLVANCGLGTGCHTAVSPAFVNEAPDATYDTFIGFKDILVQGFDPDNNELLLHGNGTHKNAEFQAGDISQIKAWIVAEKLLAEEGGGVASPLAVWSGCMNLQEWIDTDVADAWADKGSNDGDCDACHNLAAEGFMASNQDKRVFDTITQQPGLMLSYFTQDENGLVVINRERFEAVANRLAPHEVHPGFNVDNGNAMDKLEEFYGITMARVEAGDCEAPRF